MALALGGGGLRGMAHIGVLSVLVTAGLRPAMIAGTSVGGLIGALYASGMEPADIERLATGVGLHTLYDPAVNVWSGMQMAGKIAYDYLHVPAPVFSRAPLGLVHGTRFERLVARQTAGKKFTETRIPLAVTAVDLNRGQLVVFCAPRDVYRDPSGQTAFMTDCTLAEAVRASTAIPGVFEPKVIAGRMLVDGGVRDGVPADLLARMGGRPIVAVDLGLAAKRQADIDDIIEVMQQSVDIMGRAAIDATLRRYADVVITPQIGDVGLADLELIPEVIRRGAAAALAALPRIRAAVRQTLP
jgi:NTE family protein